MVCCYFDCKGESGEVFFVIYNDENFVLVDGDELFYEEVVDGFKLEWGVGYFCYINVVGMVFEVVGVDVSVMGNLKVFGDVIVGGFIDLKDIKINGVMQVGN